MKKLIFLPCFLFVIALVPNPLIGQQRQAMLKIVKSEDGTVKMYDLQGNEIIKTFSTSDEPPSVQMPAIQTGYEKIAVPATLQSNPDKKFQTATKENLNPGPDLSLYYTGIWYYDNYNITLYITVENRGTAPSGSCYLGYFLSADKAIGSDIYLGQDLINPLMPGGKLYLTPTFALSSYPLFWNIVGIIDYTGVVAEDDESNNFEYIEFCGPGPNLMVTNINWSYLITHQLNINITVQNSGDVAAGSSVLGFYLSEDMHFSATDPKLGDVPVFSLLPGSTSNKSFTVSDVFNYVSSGTWYVGAVIDETNAVNERNEMDNAYFSFEPMTISNCSIDVTHPNGGETWDEGSTQTIRWTSSNTSGNVNISYSLDSGASWITIQDNLPDNHSASWIVPDVGSNQRQCRIKIADVITSGCSDISDADFTIGNLDYALTIDVNPPGSGSVSKDPDKTKYDYKESVQLTAIAAFGYRFDHWSGDLSGNDNPANLIMNDDKRTSAVFVSNAYTNPYQVINTNDTGPGSLRQALANAALNPNPVPIVFRIPKSDPGYRSEDDVWTIKPTMVYSIGRRHLTIDGASQAEYLGLPKNSPPKIELDGRLAPDGHGISFNADDCGLNGLIINNFANTGISFSYLDQGYVFNCYIGTDATGSMARGNGTGIHINHASDIVIAPIDSTVRGSIISGNTTGIFLLDSSYKAIISGNIIGSDWSITKKLGNSGHGICLQNSCAEVLIAHNVLADNGYGIYDQSGFKNTIVYNYIGTDSLNGTDMGNKNDGIYMASTMDMCYMNTIAYNHGYGLLLMGDSHTSNTISKNSIFRNHAGGIDLRYGANNELKPPQILSITMNSVSGVAGPNQLVEVFADSLDQGRYYLGTTRADQDGKFELHLEQWPYDLHVTATTCDEFGSTSKFSSPSVSGNVDNAENHPENFIISQAYPNPFNMSASLQITLSREQHTTVEIFNYQGQKVRDLLSQRLQQGTHQINWQGTDNAGKTLAGGVYYFLCKIGTLQVWRKAVLLK
jgi:parallel beta-helix repeat protein